MEKTINIGGKDFHLRFKLGIFNHIKEITGMDGIAYVQQSGGDIVNATYVLLLAGMECYRDKHNGEAINRDELKRHVMNEGEIEDYKKVVELYISFLNPTGEEQAKEPTAIPQPSRKYKN